ncbi:MAG: hypothetical protein ABSE70_04565 [Candidatus Limnocylindrales bacterium]
MEGVDASLNAPAHIEKVNYCGWENSYRLSNDLIDLVVTTDVGPRIIRCGFVDDENEFKEYADQIGRTGGDEWRIYGGHRLWHAPEVSPRTTSPDNSAIALEDHGPFVRLLQPVEKTTGIQKEIDIRLAPDSASVRVTHRLRNLNMWMVELAPWAISVMAPGGTSILPLPPRGTHDENLLPTNTLTYWAYTDLSDPRWRIGRSFIQLREDPTQAGPQKVGLMAPAGWIGYARNGHLFVKRVAYVPGAAYPDLGCSLETYTEAGMLEIETLGPTARIEPQGSVEHVEDWSLFRDVPTPASDADVSAHVLPKIPLS